MDSSVVIEKKHNGKAIAGFVLGIIGLPAALIPLFGLPVNVVGLIMALLGLKSENKGKAKIGVVLSSIGLLLTIANAVAGVILYSKR